MNRDIRYIEKISVPHRLDGLDRACLRRAENVQSTGLMLVKTMGNLANYGSCQKQP